MQNISSLKEGDWVEETYLVTSKQVSTAKNGVVYLSLKLGDKTGEIDGRLWDNAEETSGRFEREDFVRIRGMVSNYQGSLQIKMKGLEKVNDAQIDLSNFLQSSSRDPDDMAADLRATAAGIQNAHLKKLMESFLDDRDFLELFKRTPAARTMHHNYIGGLMEHILELVMLCRDLAKHFPGVDLDLITTGAFLHDIGKVRELAVRKSIEYTTEGRLIGHISLGYEMLVEKMASLPGFPEELAMVLKHIMLSHHGEYEFGSPKRPKIQEAIIIHYLDDLSAKLNNFQTTLKKENVSEGAWTGFSRMHDRYLYRQASFAEREDIEESAAVKKAREKRGKEDQPGAAEAGTKDLPAKLPLDL